ncbi:type IV secretion system protein VirD4 [Rheinheimera pacifica]|uniref:type IV secretory system conjugative DNA transfer family protein n=1 Tax=Rheinheimera pacifica TaxID=173990 RepID=UPI00216A73D2|nr:type IV secretory system conjugative DNA transfer family protein [Rheinheimera pacifica]MCS4309492.1 type IV secretion system protein VirD4 [Rheinheimera pacifica]
MKVKGYQIFWAQIVAVVFLLFVGFWVSTQLFVLLTGLVNGELGVPSFYLYDYPIYSPLSIWSWLVHFSDIYHEEFYYAFIPLLVSVFLCFCSTVWLSILRHREDAAPTTYGTSRWSLDSEVKESELVFNEGALSSIRPAVRKKAQKDIGRTVVLGKLDDGTILRHTGPQHIAVIAPSRAMKGVGIIIPTLYSWLNSVVVTDIKKENWFATSGFRSKFSHCICFDPSDPQSAGWNPLLEVRKGERYEVRDVQNIALTLVDPNGDKNQLSHWDEAAATLLSATILHILYAEENKTLEGVAYFLTDPSRDIRYTLYIMMSTSHLGSRPHRMISSAAREMLNKSDNELSGVVSTAMNYLSLYRDPTVAKVTSRSDFRIKDIVSADKPVSLYVVVSPDEIKRLRPLIRLLLNMLGKLTDVPLTPGNEDSPYPYNLLMLMDELPAFGHMRFFETSLGFLAGYGIKAMLIAQSLAQVSNVYGRNSALMEAAHITVFYTPNPKDIDGAKQISEMLGDTTQERRNSMFSGGRLAWLLKNVTVSAQEAQRKLLTPGEVLQFPATKKIILISGLYPVIANKIKYYEDPLFMPRMLPPIPVDGTYKDYPAETENPWLGCIIAKPVPPSEDEDETGEVMVPVGQSEDTEKQIKPAEKVAKELRPEVAPEVEQDNSEDETFRREMSLQSSKRVEERRLESKEKSDLDNDISW